MKPIQPPFFIRSILTICVALCFLGVSSFGDTLILDPMNPRAHLDSGFLLNHGNPSHDRQWSHQGYQRSLAEPSLTDDLASPNQSLTFNLSGFASQILRNRTGVSDHQFVSGPKMLAESFAPRADPPVPEPANLALFGSGLCAIALVVRRRSRHHR